MTAFSYSCTTSTFPDTAIVMALCQVITRIGSKLAFNRSTVLKRHLSIFALHNPAVGYAVVANLLDGFRKKNVSL
jgi:hypothetical protein